MMSESILENLMVTISFSQKLQIENNLAIYLCKTQGKGRTQENEEEYKASL